MCKLKYPECKLTWDEFLTTVDTTTYSTNCWGVVMLISILDITYPDDLIRLLGNDYFYEVCEQTGKGLLQPILLVANLLVDCNGVSSKALPEYESLLKIPEQEAFNLLCSKILKEIT